MVPDDATNPSEPIDEHPIASRAAAIGLVTAPVLGVLSFLLLQSMMPTPAALTAGVAITMAIWWMTEALPIAVTALVPMIALPLFGVNTMKDAAAPYAHPIVYLFLGGFMVALAMQKSGLHRRLALSVLAISGTRPSRLVAGFMLATALLSMWVSNTATTMLMMPIGLSVIAMMQARRNESASSFTEAQNIAFATSLMLAIAYGANVGGMGTTVGTLPNAMMVAFLRERYNIDLSVARWMMLAMPIVIILLGGIWYILTKVIFPVPDVPISGGQDFIRGQLKELGKPSKAEKRVAFIFASTAIAWVLRPWIGQLLPGGVDLQDAGIAMLSGLILFALSDGRGGRLLDWPTARGLPWDVPILMGGGLSIAAAIKSTGLSGEIGQALGFVQQMPAVVGIFAVVLVIIYLTEITSNTATTAVFLPVLAVLADQAGMPPVMLLLPAILAASSAFMLPVATPPNAIVYGSGKVTMQQMVRAGFWLNIFGLILLTIFGAFILPWFN